METTIKSLPPKGNSTSGLVNTNDFSIVAGSAWAVLTKDFGDFVDTFELGVPKLEASCLFGDKVIDIGSD